MKLAVRSGKMSKEIILSTAWKPWCCYSILCIFNSVYFILTAICFILSMDIDLCCNWVLQSLCRCTMVEIAPVAVLKDSTPYNSTSLTDENRGTGDLSCNDVPIKLSHSAKQKTSKAKRIRLTKGRKTCAKGETFQSSQKLVSQIEKRKTLHTNGHQRVRKESQVSQRKASKEKKRMTQKFKMETVLQSTHRTPKASVTRSPSTSSLSVHKTKHMSVTKSAARALQHKRKRGKKN